MSLTDYVVMPGEDYQNICDAVREQTETTDPIKSGEAAPMIRSIQRGVQPDWNQHDPEALDFVKNRTHYAIKAFEDMVIDFTNPGEVDIIDASALNVGTAYKISDYPLTAADFENCKVTTINYRDRIREETMEPYMETDAVIIYLADSWSVMIAGVYMAGDVDGMYVPSVGTYIADVMGSLNSASIVDPGEVKQLDEAFIPGTIARTSTVEENTAKIGECSSQIAEQNALLNKLVTMVMNGKYEDEESTVILKRQFYGNAALRSVSFPNATVIEEHAFDSAVSLETVNAPYLEVIGKYAFYHAKRFGYSSTLGVMNLLVFPNLKTIGHSAFCGCGELHRVRLPMVESIGAQAFMGSSLRSIEIVNTNGVCVLENANAFAVTLIGNNSGGRIYVPSALVDSYKADPVWSAYESKIVAIEEHTDDGTLNGTVKYSY